jgi:hypothetical protein
MLKRRFRMIFDNSQSLGREYKKFVRTLKNSEQPLAQFSPDSKLLEQSRRTSHFSLFHPHSVILSLSASTGFSHDESFKLIELDRFHASTAPPILLLKSKGPNSFSVDNFLEAVTNGSESVLSISRHLFFRDCPNRRSSDRLSRRFSIQFFNADCRDFHDTLESMIDEAAVIAAHQRAEFHPGIDQISSSCILAMLSERMVRQPVTGLGMRGHNDRTGSRIRVINALDRIGHVIPAVLATSSINLEEMTQRGR